MVKRENYGGRVENGYLKIDIVFFEEYLGRDLKNL